MCCCTCISCPIGGCVGCGTAAFADGIVNPPSQPNEPLYQRRLVGLPLYQVVVAAFGISFFCLYLPLATLCSKSSKARWSIFPTEGDCWSEGNPMYVEYGLLTGALLGVSFIWLLRIIASYLNDPDRFGTSPLLMTGDENKTGGPLSDSTTEMV